MCLLCGSSPAFCLFSWQPSGLVLDGIPAHYWSTRLFLLAKLYAVLKFEGRCYSDNYIALLLRITLDIWGLLPFHMKFRIAFIVLVKNIYWNFLWQFYELFILLLLLKHFHDVNSAADLYICGGDALCNLFLWCFIDLIVEIHNFFG